MPTYTEIRYDAADHVATLTWHRPEQRNALTPTMLGEAMQAVREAQADDAVRVLVVTGAGRAFCAGGDTKAMAQVVAGSGPVPPDREQVGQIQELQILLRRFPKVLIAAVNGAAYGAGLDLACSADFRLAADTARFCEVYVRLGLAPGAPSAPVATPRPWRKSCRRAVPIRWRASVSVRSRSFSSRSDDSPRS